ncbi:MAG TPA: glycosyltransferase family 2 protein [Bacteroidales bacterium]|nr:glycosyltransferase family 2 protein [Bacteroidales bacterium]
MYKEKKISLVLPTYNEKDSIRKVINDFENLRIVDEIIVVNNNAAAGTSEEVCGTSAREVFETEQGYGASIMKGYREATGDIIILCEPDDTFLAKDIFKFLSYCEDVDVVFGSRTCKELIWSGANMGWFLRLGNWAVAKLLEVLFNTNTLTDVGCTYRLIHRSALEELMPTFLVKTEYFGPEMMVRSYLKRYKCIQIPVVYKQRIGTSSVTGDLKKAFVLGLKMIFMIILIRIKSDKLVLKAFK